MIKLASQADHIQQQLSSHNKEQVHIVFMPTLKYLLESTANFNEALIRQAAVSFPHGCQGNKAVIK